MRILIPILLFAGSCPALLAQSLASERKFFSPWPETGTVAFDRAKAGRLGEDHLLDPVVWRTRGASGPVWQPNTHRINAAYQLGDGGARDAAILPGVAPGQRDGLLLLTPLGLELHWAATGQALAQIAVHGEGWETVERVWVVKSQNGQSWICGLDTNGWQLRRLVWDGQAFVTCTPLPAGPGITWVESADVDGNGEFEMLFWCDPWLFIFDWSGEPIGYLSAIVEPGDATPPVAYRRSCTVSRGQRTGNAVHRDLVVVHLYRCSATQGETNAQWWSFAFNSSVAAWTPLGDVAANHMAPVDMDGDGRQDLLLARSDRAEAVVLYRTGDASLFRIDAASSRARLIVPSGEDDAGLDFCLPGDFDFDGDADFIAYQGARARTHSFYGNVIAGRRTRLDTVSGVPSSPGQLAVQVVRPVAWAAMVADPIAGELKVQIEGWVQPTSTALLLPGRRIFVCETAAFSQSGTMPMTLSYDPSGLTAGHYVLQLHVSIVRVDGTTITQRYPSTLVFCAADGEYVAVLHDGVNQEMASTGPTDGDGSVDGNKGNKPPDQPPLP